MPALEDLPWRPLPIATPHGRPALCHATKPLARHHMIWEFRLAVYVRVVKIVPEASLLLLVYY